MTAPEADLSGWVVAPFSGGGYTHDVYRKGAGPGVVLIPEIPGIHPGVLGLGNHLVDNGFTVAIPSLFGEPGRAKTNGSIAASLARACVAREFAAFATNKQRPVSQYLRALARDLNASTPGKGVGVIGQCFTGGFALAARSTTACWRRCSRSRQCRCRWGVLAAAIPGSARRSWPPSPSAPPLKACVPWVYGSARTRWCRLNDSPRSSSGSATRSR